MHAAFEKMTFIYNAAIYYFRTSTKADIHRFFPMQCSFQKNTVTSSPTQLKTNMLINYSCMTFISSSPMQLSKKRHLPVLQYSLKRTVLQHQL